MDLIDVPEVSVILHTKLVELRLAGRLDDERDKNENRIPQEEGIRFSFLSRFLDFKARASQCAA